MRKLILILLILTSVQAFSQNMIIKPDMPKATDELRLIYDPTDIYKELAQKTLLVYSFTADSNEPLVTEKLIVYDSLLSVYTATVDIPESAVFGMIRVAGFDEKEILRFDDNSGDWWHFFVYDQAGLKQEKASMKAAASYLGNLRSGLNRNVDYKKALNFLEEETKLYPNNLSAQIGLTSLLFDLKKIDKDDFYDLMKKHLDKQPDLNDENTVRAVSRALRILNENSKAQSLEDQFIKRKPNSDLAEEYFLDELGQAESLKDFTSKAKSYFNNFPESDKRKMIFNAVISGFLQSDKYPELLQFLNSLTDVPAYAHADLAIRLASDKSLLNSLSNEARIDSASTLFENAFPRLVVYDENEPAIISDYESKLLKASYAANWAAVIADYKETTAEEYFRKAGELFGNEADLTYYRNYSAFLIENGENTNALALIEEAIANNQYDNFMTDNYLELRSVVYNESDEEVEKQYELLLEDAHENQMYELNFEIVNIPVSNFTLKDITGRTVEFKSLTSDATVIFFWAAWCGPCQASFLSFQDIFDSFKEDANVRVLSINLWDNLKSIDELEKFIDENELKFSVYYDEQANSAEEFGISGLPVVGILEGSNIKFKINGFTEGTEFIDNILDRIDYIMEKQQ